MYVTCAAISRVKFKPYVQLLSIALLRKEEWSATPQTNITRVNVVGFGSFVVELYTGTRDVCGWLIFLTYKVTFVSGKPWRQCHKVFCLTWTPFDSIQEMDEEDAGGGVAKSPIRRLGSTRKLLIFNSKQRELINYNQRTHCALFIYC
jgi:hypothetical protein